MSTPAYALSGLTPDQTKVLDALAKGATLTAAAQCAAIHRTTLHHWRRHHPTFSSAVDNARQAYRGCIQVEYEELADAALATVKGIMDDPKASPGVRLKAALAVLNKVVNEPMVAAPAPTRSYQPSPDPEPLPEPIPVPEPDPEPVPPSPESEPDYAAIHAELDRIEQELANVPDYLQPVETIRRAGPKPGRNEQCPCGSNIKYKKCCGK